MAIHDRLVEENNRVVEIRQQRYKEIADNRNKKLAEARTKYEAKIEAMQSAGVHVSASPAMLGETMLEALKR